MAAAAEGPAGRSPRSYVVAREGDVPEGGVIPVRAGRTVFALARFGGRYYAIHNRCQHKGGPLCRGTVDPGRRVIRCPWHLWDWSLETGRLQAYPHKKMPVADVEVIDGSIVVRL